jgi:baculoviral IAP repeat-containing protein 7/8
MLSEWEPNDIPIVEHAKFFSQCQWLIASKGKEFVERIQQV